LDGRYNLTVEMETGVGKTYTYIKAMYELNKRYGWSKFIIVVPSMAIREDVYKSFQITEEHFAEDYGKKIRYFIYNSAQLTEIDRFASDSAINVMIINSQAFNARSKDARRINMKLDEFRSRKPINAVALREAFINAVVHNDYNLGWPVVEFFSDRVTITSTGGLVAGLSLEDFFNGRSMLRNRELMRVFKDVELVEGLGSGMRRILEAYDRSVFEITPGFIVVTFPYASDFDRSVSGNERSPGRRMSEDVSEVLTESELKKVKPLLDFLESHGSITPQEARAITGKTAKTTWRYLNMLCERGVIDSAGHTSAKTYRLNAPTNGKAGDRILPPGSRRT
jgi:predicted HTH transcriptional regulator